MRRRGSRIEDKRRSPGKGAWRDPPPPRLIAVDLDGTLLEDELKVVHPRAARLIREATQRDIRVVLTSARSFRSTWLYHAELGLETPLVCYNGAQVLSPRGEELASLPLDPEISLSLARLVRERGFYAKVFLGDRFLVEEPTEETYRYSPRYFIPFQAVGPLADHLAARPEPVYSFVIHTPEKSLLPLKREIEGKLPVTCHAPNEHALHISSCRASKLRALEFLAEREGIPPGETAAIGDGDNDIEMILWAGQGWAVANCSPALREVAPRLAPLPTGRGVAWALERILGLQPAAI